MKLNVCSSLSYTLDAEMAVELEPEAAGVEQVAPEAGTGEGFGAAVGGVDGRDLGEDSRDGTMFLTADIAVAHERDMLAADSVDAVQHIAPVSQFGKDDIPHLQLLGTDERDRVAASLDERAHAHTRRRELYLLAFCHKAGNLGDEDLVGELHGGLFVVSG